MHNPFVSYGRIHDSSIRYAFGLKVYDLDVVAPRYSGGAPSSLYIGAYTITVTSDISSGYDVRSKKKMIQAQGITEAEITFSGYGPGTDEGARILKVQAKLPDFRKTYKDKYYRKYGFMAGEWIRCVSVSSVRPIQRCY